MPGRLCSECAGVIDRRLYRSDAPFYLRPCKGQKYQVRIYLSPTHGSISCGLYPEAEAEQVRRAVVKAMAHHPLTPVGVYQACMAVAAAGKTATGRHMMDATRDRLAEVLPKYVYRHRDGGYGATVKLAGVRIYAPGPYADPVEAHRVMVARIVAIHEQAAQSRRDGMLAAIRATEPTPPRCKGGSR